MNKFYFFKVTLSYFDDKKITFFITPDQSEKDDEGIPFSEDNLRNTAEFKDFVKTTKADVIDIDYIEYAVDYDPKKSEILGSSITEESFSSLENGSQLEVVDQNQFLILVKKQSKGSSSKTVIIWVLAATAVVIMMLLFGMEKGGFFGEPTSENSVTSNTSSEFSSASDTSEPSAESSDISETSDITDISESSVNSDASETDKGNTHEPTSDSKSENASTSENESPSFSESSDNSENSTNNGSSVEEKVIFNLSDWSNMSVTVDFNLEEPEVTFIDPQGNEISGSEYTSDHKTNSVCYYIDNAEPGQWRLRCDKKGNTELSYNWAEYDVLPEIGE